MAIYLHNIHLMLHATFKGKLVILGKYAPLSCHPKSCGLLAKWFAPLKKKWEIAHYITFRRKGIKEYQWFAIVKLSGN